MNKEERLQDGKLRMNMRVINKMEYSADKTVRHLVALGIRMNSRI
jgi:hypothetical protein